MSVAARSHDLIVVGAGVVGSALAYAQARQGRKVLLVERDWAEPDRIVGELLQPGGVAALHTLGLESALENIDAVRCDGYQVIYHGESVPIPYPSDPETGKQKHGRSFVHGRFIRNLRDLARSSPNVTTVQATVSELVRNPVTDQVLGVSCSLKGWETKQHVYTPMHDLSDQQYFAPLTVVCDGCFSKFRKQFIRKNVVVRSNFVGLVLHDIQLPCPNHGHVVLSKSAPILMYQIDTHETRVLVDVPGEKLPSQSSGALKEYLATQVLPNLPETVQPAFRKALLADRFRSMPNSWLPPSTNETAGLVMLGDAMNMRHPLTGGGMTVGLNDVVLLSDLLAGIPDLQDTQSVLVQLRRFHWKRKNLASVVNILAQALYSLFAADGTAPGLPLSYTNLPDERLEVLQRGCFRYFQLGGQAVQGPVGLLSGVHRQPLLLFFHFFAVAFYSIWLFVVSGTHSILSLPLTCLQSVGVFWKACIVIFPYIFSELAW